MTFIISPKKLPGFGFCSLLELQTTPSQSLTIALEVVVPIHQALNVIIRSVRFTYFFLLITFTLLLGHCTDDNFGAGPNGIVLR